MGDNAIREKCPTKSFVRVLSAFTAAADAADSPSAPNCQLCGAIVFLTSPKDGGRWDGEVTFEKELTDMSKKVEG